jgi:hypothetical protein
MILSRHETWIFVLRYEEHDQTMYISSFRKFVAVHEAIDTKWYCRPVPHSFTKLCRRDESSDAGANESEFRYSFKWKLDNNREWITWFVMRVHQVPAHSIPFHSIATLPRRDPSSNQFSGSPLLLVSSLVSPFVFLPFFHRFFTLPPPSHLQLLGRFYAVRDPTERK